VIFKCDEEKTKLLFVLIHQQVEPPLFCIMNYFTNVRNLECIVYVYQFLCRVVVVNTIVFRRNDKDILITIQLEERGLSVHWIFVLVNIFDLAISVVEFEDLILFGKDQGRLVNSVA